MLPLKTISTFPSDLKIFQTYAFRLCVYGNIFSSIKSASNLEPFLGMPVIQWRRTPQKLRLGKKKHSKFWCCQKGQRNPKSNEMCWCIKCQHQTDFPRATRQARWTEKATSFAPYIEICSTYASRKSFKRYRCF